MTVLLRNLIVEVVVLGCATALAVVGVLPSEVVAAIFTGVVMNRVRKEDGDAQ